MSLREQKKELAKVAIQQAALRLFAGQGYARTTVEQIAAEANVSPSTFFRYFTTKEAVVLYDSLDPLIMAAFENQPADVSVIRALRNAMKEIFENLPPEKKTLEQERNNILRKVPEVRAKMLDEMVRSTEMLAELIAARLHRSADELAIRNLAGAIIGVGLAALARANDREPTSNSVATFDESLAELERGLLDA
ncbi:MAG TPA: TetR family transcriptional regulator [Candidatus Saccharimonadales bacterium]